jgi:ABC-type transporter Mla subunit MlaD
MFERIMKRLDRIEELLEASIHKENTMGKELDDLTAAVGTLTANNAALSDALTKTMETLDSISSLLTAGAAAQDGPALESLAQTVQAVNASQQASTAALLAKVAADTPPVVPAPAPAPVAPAV